MGTSAHAPRRASPWIPFPHPQLHTPLITPPTRCVPAETRSQPVMTGQDPTEAGGTADPERAASTPVQRGGQPRALKAVSTQTVLYP